MFVLRVGQGLFVWGFFFFFLPQVSLHTQTHPSDRYVSHVTNNLLGVEVDPGVKYFKTLKLIG